MTAERGWDDHAEWWQRFFTDGADYEYTDQIIPLLLQELPGDGLVVDIGAGEGQICRAAAAHGLRAIALEPSPKQIAEGAARNETSGTAVAFARSVATASPLRSNVADAAICCLVIEHVADLDGLFSEAARILRPGARLLVVMNHPLVQTPDSAWVDDHVMDPPESYWRVGNYLEETDTLEEVTRGVFIHFYFRPLHRYLNSARRSGLVLDQLFEPEPAKKYLQAQHSDRDARFIPRLMMLALAKVG